MCRIINIIGNRYGRLVVVDLVRIDKLVYWKCKCDCGSEKIVLGHSLRSGHTQSCGCLQRVRASMYNKNHSGEKHPMYGKHHSEEFKKKVSESTSGRNNPMYGKTHSDESKKKMSHALIGKRSGNKCNFWKGGITNIRNKDCNSIEYKTWRNEVFHRDNFTCRKCGDSLGGNLQAHHILMWSKHKNSRYDLKNGITLCKRCHESLRHHEDEVLNELIGLVNLSCRNE